MRTDHRLVVELLREGGEVIDRASLTPDWEPAIECARLTGLRTRRLWAPASSSERHLEPLWHPELGEPYARGFRIHLELSGVAAWHEEFSIAYFADLARTAAAPLIEKGVLAKGQSFLYRVLAYAQPHVEDPPDPDAFATFDQPPPLPVRSVPLEALMGASVEGGDAQAGDFDVFIPDGVLAEATTLTLQAGDIESGGILIGHLNRDPGGGDIALEITALIPARHAVGHAAKLTFTSETWTDVRHAVALRRTGELVLGWFHSHPQGAWCREKGCSPEQQRQCSAADGFFSVDDAALHRTMFSRAFTVALVMTHSVKGVIPRLFGWRAGRIAPRGFRVVTPTVQTGEPSHAAPTTA
jgi:hypothetical protein